jgi:hypothetical protein
MKRILQTAVILLIPLFLFSQETGKIAGKVTDEATGQPLAGANVLVEGTSYGAATDAEGNFIILGVPMGAYTVRSEFIGYRPMRISGARVSSRLTTTTDFALSSEALELGVVDVVAVRPLINPSATNAVRSMASDQLENLATRDVTTFFNLQAGVVFQNQQLHIRGSRPDEVGFELEGASTRSLMVGGVFQGGGQAPALNPGGGSAYNLGVVIPEALEEISLQSGGYSADLGGANAGIVQQKLKTGGEQLSGSVVFETEQFASALDGLLPGDETYDYGGREITATLGGALTPSIRFFGAFQQLGSDNYAPQFWKGDTIYNAEGGLDHLPVTPGGEETGDTVQINWADGLVDGRRSDRTTINGNLLFDFNPLVLRLSYMRSNSLTQRNDTPIDEIFNWKRQRVRDDLSQLLNAKATVFLSSNTLINLSANSFQYNRDFYEPEMGKPDDFFDVLSWADSAAVVEEYGEEYSEAFRSQYILDTPYYVNEFAFSRPGNLEHNWTKQAQSYLGFDGNLTTQMGAHELKVGGSTRTYTIRRYRLYASRIISTNQAIDGGLMDSTDIADKTETAAQYLRSGRVTNVGYDEFGDELDKGVDGARHPSTLSMYFNDKIEMEDIIINVGVRYDKFDLDDFSWKDPENPGYNAAGFSAYEDELEKAETHGIIQPRLGLAFPLSDKSVFHLQYGKFAQFPDLANPYKGQGDIASSYGGQNFIQDPIGFDLKPVITTQYEVGLSYQFADGAAFDVTAFTRNTIGQLALRRVDEIGIPDDNTYAVDPSATHYVNGDFTTVSGLEFSLGTRRLGPFQAMLNYTWTDARGTNSFPNSLNGNLNFEGVERPSLITPLRYEQKHKGTLNLDYRYGDEGGPLLSNFGVNLLFTFNSGHPFTRATGGMGQRAADEGALLVDVDTRNREPVEAIGNSTTPWMFNTDLRINKGFTVGGINMSAYLLATNLFNTQHILNVYNRSGDAYNDGFLTDPELSSVIVANEGPVYEEMYRSINLDHRQHWLVDQVFDIFGTPRQVKVGLKVAF